MDSERKDYHDLDKVQEKSSEDLESYKKLLEKELDSIRGLVNSETVVNNTTSTSNAASEKVISQSEYSKLQEENRTLKLENESINSAIQMLENDNRLLRENIATLNLKYSNLTELENEISRLKEVILNVEKEKWELKAKITEKIVEVEEIPNQDSPLDISNEIKTFIESNEPIKTSTTPVHTGYTVPPIKPKKFRRKTSQKSVKVSVDVPSESPIGDSTSYSVSDSEKIIEETVRRKCPTCLNTNKKFIREMVDKSNILMQNPRIYGKKYKCGLCTTEWK